jgi:hypothetical protein
LSSIEARLRGDDGGLEPVKHPYSGCVGAKLASLLMDSGPLLGVYISDVLPEGHGAVLKAAKLHLLCSRVVVAAMRADVCRIHLKNSASPLKSRARCSPPSSIRRSQVDSNPTAWYAVIHDRALQRMYPSRHSDAVVVVVVDELIRESTVELSLSQMPLLSLAAFVHSP